ncbi:MAG TPA: hypothetical protein VD813_03975 [Pseudonocardia sp.]|nr:hypothetical protein [Pseudonocardia sp.]
MRDIVIDHRRDPCREDTDAPPRPGIRSELRDTTAAIMSVSGPVDDSAVHQVEAVLKGLILAGARHVVVDLSQVSTVTTGTTGTGTTGTTATTCGDGLAAVLRRQRAALNALGGWLTLLGGSVLAGGWEEPSLADLFEAYRRARPTTGAPVGAGA